MNGWDLWCTMGRVTLRQAALGRMFQANFLLLRLPALPGSHPEERYYNGREHAQTMLSLLCHAECADFKCF